MRRVARTNSSTAHQGQALNLPTFYLQQMAAASFARMCATPGSETLLNSIVEGLLLEQRLPPGSFLDAGAYNGELACYWAELTRRTKGPNRTIIAIDPDEANIDTMRTWGHPNLVPIGGLLGDKDRVEALVTDSSLGSRPGGFIGADRIRTRNRSMAYRASLRIPVHTIDTVYSKFQHGERLGLAHLDLEGSELLALLGANATIARDRPVITTEVMIQGKIGKAEALINHMASIYYDSFVIEEITGIRADLRNLIHFPRERHGLLAESATLNLAVALRGLVAVNSSTISKHGFPCCLRGGKCCPTDTQGRLRGQCCSHGAVHMWMSEVVRNGGADLQWSTRTTWYDQHRYRFQRAPYLLHYQEQVRERLTTSGTGFTFNTKTPRLRNG